MNTETNNETAISEASKRMNELRRRTIRYNILMVLFFILIIVGLFGAVFYYNNVKNLNTRLKFAEDSIAKVNVSLEKARKDIAIEKSRSDSFLLLSQKGNHKDTAAINKFVAQIDTSRARARNLADAGYKMLIKHDLKGALNAFRESEQAYNGYRDSYEVYFLLWKNKDRLDDPASQEQLIQMIMSKYDTYGLLKKYYKPTRIIN